MAARGLGSRYFGMTWCPHNLREAIYYRDRDPKTGRMRCVWCGLTVWRHGERGRRRVCLDHLLPVSLGGTHGPRNIVTACFHCNRTRGACDYEAWVDSCNWDPKVDARIMPITLRDLSPTELRRGRQRRRALKKKRQNVKVEGSRPESGWRH